MTKTIFILTREFGEYDAWWGFDNKDRIKRLDIDQERKAVFIRQDDRALHENSNTITRELNGGLPDEIGIILHKVENNEAAAAIREGLSTEVKARLRFCTWYSTRQGGFWDIDNPEREDLPCNAFMVAVRSGLDLTAAFEKFWGFFLYDAALEAGLGLIQCVLNETSPEPEVVKLLRENVSGFDERFDDFVRALSPGAVERQIETANFYTRLEEFKQLSGDIFSTEYQTAYEKLRDALGVE